MDKQVHFNRGFTTANTKESNFTWSIKNYSVIKENLVENKIISPTFKVTPEDPNSWCIILYPENGISGSFPKYLSISLAHESISTNNFVPVKVKYSLALVNINETQTLLEEKTYTYKKIKGFDGFNKWIHEDSLSSGFLINDELTIICKYTLFYTETLSNSITYTQKFNPHKLWDNFEKLLDSEKLSDFTLIAPCGKKLRAHKFILASHSPVFLAMLDSKMKETMVDQVEISDISFEGLREMLRFMYSAKIHTVDEVAENVLMAAEKYQIPEIKYFCEDYFYEHLNVENVIEILYLCLRFNLYDILDDHICRFIKDNQKSVIESSGFKNMDDPDVLRFVSRSLVID